MSRLTRSKRLCRRALLALGSATAAFLIFQAALDWAIESQPTLRDPEFGEKLSRLQTQIARHPERPLLLILGSSRSSCGLVPAAMSSPSAEAASQPLIFNMAITGCGPVQQVQVLERLHRAGIRPNWILAEIHPLLLHQRPGQWSEEAWIRPEKLDWHDLATIGAYLSQEKDWRWRWAKLRLLPAWWFRFQLLNRFSPGWLDTRLRQDGAWCELDDAGWLPLRLEADAPPPEARRRHAYAQYAAAFNDFRVTATADHALRRFIELAQSEGARVGFYLMPEGETFRNWYPAGARETVAAYLARLDKAEGIPVFDASRWCVELDFADSHHLLADPAMKFSAQFGRDVVQPFLRRSVSFQARRPALAP